MSLCQGAVDGRRWPSSQNSRICSGQKEKSACQNSSRHTGHEITATPKDVWTVSSVLSGKVKWLGNQASNLKVASSIPGRAENDVVSFVKALHPTWGNVSVLTVSRSG